MRGLAAVPSCPVLPGPPGSSSPSPRTLKLDSHGNEKDHARFPAPERVPGILGTPSERNTHTPVAGWLWCCRPVNSTDRGHSFTESTSPWFTRV